MTKPFVLTRRARATDNPDMSRLPSPPNTSSSGTTRPIAALSSNGAAMAAVGPRSRVAACAVDLAAADSAPVDFRLLPAGSFRSWDGRPQDAAAWVMTPDDGARLVAEAAARTSDRVIDYEHATILRAKSGEKSPAAGWFRKLEWRPGSGLWAIGVQWTAQAAKHIADREYRYLSPVFSYDETSGRVLTLLHASLTNDPGLDGLTDLAALAAELFASPTRQEQLMPETLKKLLAALGLQETASEAEALSAVAALKTNVATLGAQIATPPDPARFIPVATLAALQAEHATVKGTLAALTAEIDAAKVAKVVEDGLAAGKLTPATAGWARELGAQNIASLTVYLEAAPVVMKPGETQSGGKKPAGGSAGLDTDDPNAVARAALSYQTAQAAAGIRVSTQAAVRHVTKTSGD